jgi:hypothetical protein
MLAVMSEEQERQYPGKDIILRASMIKAFGRPARTPDPAMYTLDLVRWTSLKVGVGISAEPMAIMVERGVPQSVFLKLQQTVLDQLQGALLPAKQGGETEAEASRRLRASVYALGAVGLEAKKRECTEQGKSLQVAGLISRWTEEVERGNPALAAEEPYLLRDVSASDVDPISGQPYAMAEA